MRPIFPLALFVLLAVPALADPAPGSIMKAPPPAGAPAATPAQICTAKFEMQVIAVKHLETALALGEKQKPLFKAWRDTRLAIRHGWPCPPPSVGLDVPTPTRLERQIAMTNLTLESLHKEQPATVALYESLTPQQRAVFDGPVSGTPQEPPKPEQAH